MTFSDVFSRKKHILWESYVDDGGVLILHLLNLSVRSLRRTQKRSMGTQPDTGATGVVIGQGFPVGGREGLMVFGSSGAAVPTFQNNCMT